MLVIDKELLRLLYSTFPYPKALFKVQMVNVSPPKKKLLLTE
jgi:hypothetical protein